MNNFAAVRRSAPLLLMLALLVCAASGLKCYNSFGDGSEEPRIATCTEEANRQCMKVLIKDGDVNLLIKGCLPNADQCDVESAAAALREEFGAKDTEGVEVVPLCCNGDLCNDNDLTKSELPNTASACAPLVALAAFAMLLANN